MKLKYIAFALLPLTLAACQANDLQKTGDIAMSVLQQQNPSKTLSAYEWHLDTGAEKHLVLQLLDGGRFSVATTCNTLGGSWKASNGILETSQMMMTMMGCSTEAQKQENFASQPLENGKLPFVLNLKDVENQL